MKIFTRLFLISFLLITRLALAANYTIQVSSNQYSPSSLTVNPGDVVTFQWVSGDNQTLSDNNAWPAFQLGNATPSRSMVMNTAGTFNFHSMNHAAVTGTIVVRSVSSLKENKLQASLDAYPNPTRGETTIRLNQSGGENYKIRISNAIGRVVKIVDVPENLGDGISIDLSSLPNGLYFYSLLANEKMMETKRLIVQH